MSAKIFLRKRGETIRLFLGLQVPFHAAHRLHTAAFSESENANLYGKCNNPVATGIAI